LGYLLKLYDKLILKFSQSSTKQFSKNLKCLEGLKIECLRLVEKEESHTENARFFWTCRLRKNCATYL